MGCGAPADFQKLVQLQTLSGFNFSFPIAPGGGVNIAVVIGIVAAVVVLVVVVGIIVIVCCW